MAIVPFRKGAVAGSSLPRTRPRERARRVGADAQREESRMGILGRINSVIKSNVNDLLDRMTDPGKEIDLLITDMEENLKKAHVVVVTCTANATRSGMACQRLQTDLDQWQRRAEQAVRAGDDALAKEALERRMAVDADLAQARRVTSEQEAYAGQLLESLKHLEEKIKEVKGRKETLKARARMAKQGRPALSGGKAFEEFKGLEDRIEAMEAEGDLTSSLDARDAAVEAKFAHLEKEKDPKVEDALAELKRKVDKKE
jgi:phage shock protein A